MDPLVYRAKLQHSEAELGTCEYSHSCLEPLTLSNSKEGDSATYIQEFGSRARAVHISEANYI